MKIAAFSTLIVGLLLLSVNAEQAYAASSSMILPISGTVAVPLGDDSTDEVSLNGKFHVVVGTSSSNSGDLLIHANLADVTGVGSSSGSTYNATGSTTIVLHNLENTIVPPSFTFDFNLIKYPPSPCVDGNSCSSGNTASLFPLKVAFSVQQSELGFWVTRVCSIASSYPPSPC
ncbi:MAG: hypothetical protein P8079_02020 [Gammaproteobacteria bacterium]